MEVTITGIDSMINTVNRFLNIDERLDRIAKRLCEVGEPIIRQTHGHHAKVWYEQTSTGYRIVAEGQDILFIEFGAGDMAGTTVILYDQVPAVVRPGSWSETHAQQYSTQGFWFFGGKMYRETVPHPAFYYAYQAMVQALQQIATEEFQK